MPTFKPSHAFLALALSIALIVGSCQDQSSVTEAPHAPHAAVIAAPLQTTAISPTGDTYLNINATNNAAAPTLNLYTWPDARSANAIVMKFDLASIPAGSTVSSATLHLNLTGSDASADPTYTVTVHRIVNKNPVVSSATGYTYDGSNSWTPNSCCYNNIPLAQADIGAPVDTKNVDKTPGFKEWDVTSLVQGWLSNPAANFGLLVNSDPSKARDRYRTFSSSEEPVASSRPYLTVVYAPPDTATPPPQPPAGQPLSLFPPIGDTYLNINATNNAAAATLNLHTWPDAKSANAIVMKFDLRTLPAGSTISSATLNLNLTGSDATADPTYTVTVHRIVNKNPVVNSATGYTYDGVNSWTPNGCCYNGVPLAQADIGAPVDTKNVDKTPGFKQWDVTSLVQGWLSNPAANFGLLVNSDPSKARDRYRTFSSSEEPVASSRPYLTVVYAPPDTATPPPQPPAGQPLSLFPPIGDTYLNINATNNAAAATLNLHTWPDAKSANAIVMKFDLRTLPAGSTISSATLNLNLTGSDATADPTYTVTVHRIVNKNPVVNSATGYTYDGVNSWTPNGCCYNGVPLAQADIGAPVDTKNVDKTPGFKQWDVTSLVQGWLSNPAANFGLLVNSDPSKARDRYRTFSSGEEPVASSRPYLTVVYAPPDTATPPPQPPAGQPSSLFPPIGDTYLNINATNNAAAATLNLHTWPDAKSANAIVMKFDLRTLPAGSTISSATLNLNLTGSDATADPTYTVTVHRIVNKNPVVNSATGYTYDGVNSWTPNGCCYNGVPLAQADIGAPVDTKNVDKTPGFKQWDVTSLARDWLSNPAANFGLLVNSDPSKARDRYRTFSSSDDSTPSRRPYLRVVYTPPDTVAPSPEVEARVGRWSSVFPAPIVQLHVHLLRDGTVLSWGLQGDPQVWEPATGTFTPVPSPSLLFCAGHTFLADGRLLVAGGHISGVRGLPNTNLFDAATRSWQVAPPMARGRWYPTNTTLPDGEVLSVAGTD